MRYLKKLVSPATVIATLALMVAIGGSAYALSKNSVGAKELGKVVVRAKSETVGSGNGATIVKPCRKGEELLSGGAGWKATSGILLGYNNMDINRSYPTGNKGGREWLVTGHNETAGNRDLIVYVRCLQR